MHAKKTAFVVEHDFIMATYLADRVIVYEGEPSIRAKANSPVSLLSGMNQFLESLEITFRRDPTNHRPRINKHASQLDQEQKSSGDYFFMDATVSRGHVSLARGRYHVSPRCRHVSGPTTTHTRMGDKPGIPPRH